MDEIKGEKSEPVCFLILSLVDLLLEKEGTIFGDTTPLDHPLYKMFSLSQGSDCAKTDADFCAFLLLLRLSRREYLKDCSLSS